MPGAPGARLGRGDLSLHRGAALSLPRLGEKGGRKRFPFLPGQRNSVCLNRKGYFPFSPALASHGQADPRNVAQSTSLAEQSLSQPDGCQLPLHKGGFGTCERDISTQSFQIVLTE